MPKTLFFQSLIQFWGKPIVNFNDAMVMLPHLSMRSEARVGQATVVVQWRRGMETKTFTRRQLYELVWQRPLRDVARELGISDVALGKACRRHGIPLPGRGYWAKIAAGQKLTPVPLPAVPGVASQLSFTPVVPTPAPPPIPAQLSEPRKRHADEPLVLSTLEAPHPLVKQLRRALHRQDIDTHGQRSVRSPKGWSLTTSPESEERALVILDTLLQRLKSAGARVMEQPPERYQTEPTRYLSLDGEDVIVTLRETYRQQRKTEEEVERERKVDGWARQYLFIPTGRLTLSIDNYPRRHEATWSDSKLPLENVLLTILTTLLALPDLLKEQRHKAREAELARLEEERRRAEARRQFERRQQCLTDLLGEAQRWQQHAALTAYLDELEKRAAAHPHLQTETFKEGVAVARQLASSLLPFEERMTRLAEFGLLPNREIEQAWLRMPALTAR